MGHVLCQTKQCPPIPCTNPVKLDGQCCATCPDSTLLSDSITQKHCVNDGIAFNHGSRWSKSDCSSCRCNDGEINCFTQKCPTVSCENPAHLKGQCCPVCPGKIFPLPMIVCIVLDLYVYCICILYMSITICILSLIP